MAQATETVEKTETTEQVKTEEVKTEETTSESTPEVKAEDKTEEVSTALGAKGKVEESDDGENLDVTQYEDFNLPEGINLDETRLEKAVPLMRELELDQGKAQKIIDLYVELQGLDAEKQNQEFIDTQKDWVKQLDAHPDFGGVHKEETLDLANRVVGRFGGDELREVLDQTGMGNHWAIIMAFARIGKFLGEDTLVTSGEKSVNPNTKSDGELLYPDMYKDKK